MKRARTRRATALIVGLAMLAGLLGFAPTANADVGPAGPVTFTVEGGTINIADGAVAICLEDGQMWDENSESCVDDPEWEDDGTPPSSLSGTIDSDGNVTVPGENVVFPPLTLTEPLEINVTIGSSQDVAGVIDPLAGTASMDLTLDIGLYLVLFATQCQLTLPMSLSGTYDQTTGIADVTDADFAMPGASCPGNEGLEPLINGQVGLPSPSGSNAVNLVLQVDPLIEAIIPEGPPVVIDTSATIGVGGAATRTITELANPVQTCALVGPNGGATLAESVTVNGFQVTYVHDANAGTGTDTVQYECTNGIGSDSGTLTVQIQGNERVCGEPNQATVPDCGLDQFIEFEILGDVLSMSQEEANVSLETITLNGAPQVTSGSMNTVTVVNRRGDGQAWSLTGQVTDFKVDGLGDDCPATDPSTWRHQCIPGDNLGWSPVASVLHQQVPGDVAAVAAGSEISPSDIAAGNVVGNGLGSSAQALCSAAETTSGGSFGCGAGLYLVVPASAAAGQYQATLTLTLS